MAIHCFLSLRSVCSTERIKMPISQKERDWLEDLFIKENQNLHILFRLANNVTGNVVDIATPQEALDFICMHVRDLVTLLNKKSITKEILFKYLHSKRTSVVSDFTKATLVSKVIEYWKNTDATNLSDDSKTLLSLTSKPCPENHQNVESIPSGNSLDEVQYPIHLLARKFSEWFFENYNNDTLKEEDFWSDSRLVLRIAASDRIDDQECWGASATLNNLLSCKRQFEFYFNPNLTHSGVQGRMDVHGLVLVLVCGTLHTQLNCVGVFECTFGLMRDPFSENNWKMKTLQMLLRSQGTHEIPNLRDSQTLQDMLSLPVPMGELT